MVNKDNYGVIMAGGIGSRFWPMSKSSFPKQFHDILGTGQTLIQMTYQRFLKVCEPQNIYVVTNDRYTDLVLEQLPEMDRSRVLGEPFMRNTAPCIAYANFKIAKQNQDAKIIVAPSDHLIMNEDSFIDHVQLALDQADQTTNLVTLGIKPNRPDTGYGYIQFEEIANSPDERLKKVKTFTEKPDLDLARNFLASGDFYWNSGIFIWSLANIQEAFKNFLPEMYSLFDGGKEALDTDGEAQAIEAIYSQCDNISIDYGIMESAKNVTVVLSEFGWSDLGTWGSLYTHVDLDLHNNAVVGENVMMYSSANNMVYTANEKLLVLHGLNGYIVVETEQALLVCKRDDEQKIKQFVNDIKLQKGDSFV
jgi:mannose-1-phosphate guanylyltransferase